MLKKTQNLTRFTLEQVERDFIEDTLVALREEALEPLELSSVTKGSLDSPYGYTNALEKLIFSPFAWKDPIYFYLKVNRNEIPEEAGDDIALFNIPHPGEDIKTLLPLKFMERVFSREILVLDDSVLYISRDEHNNLIQISYCESHIDLNRREADNWHILRFYREEPLTLTINVEGGDKISGKVIAMFAYYRHVRFPSLDLSTRRLCCYYQKRMDPPFLIIRNEH